MSKMNFKLKKLKANAKLQNTISLPNLTKYRSIANTYCNVTEDGKVIFDKQTLIQRTAKACQIFKKRSISVE